MTTPVSGSIGAPPDAPFEPLGPAPALAAPLPVPDPLPLPEPEPEPDPEPEPEELLPLASHGPAPCLSQSLGSGAIWARRLTFSLDGSNVGLLQELTGWVLTT